MVDEDDLEGLSGIHGGSIGGKVGGNPAPRVAVR